MKAAKIEMLVLLIVLSITTFAGTGEKKTTRSSKIEVVKNDQVFKLFYLADDERDVNVKIVGKRGEVLFTEKINGLKGFTRPYNFENLPEGDYKFVVLDESGTMEFDVAHNDLKKENAHFVRFDELKGISNKLYKLSIAGEGQHVAQVKIYDNESHLLYQGKESFTNNFAQLYNLMQITTNGYVEVILGDKKEIFNF
ncbi:hypothetical protein [Fulvivirga lutea]|uniref:Uncharacterized protein n=1 Tax=Fulvivirga lutea TaxID=2810512 RepID=A0A975A1A4_9BACT|nr:hypothetical protein [Fulvivirga lutea]QSE98091.1 hypothetical protein JR347_03140 [Fulvivirga lutea]